jgi:hypothetical protein
MLKEAIPAKLFILGGENPLTLLYQPLSAGLHDLSDEECLQQAADIRTELTALLENIADVLKDQDELRNAAAPAQTPEVVEVPVGWPGHPITGGPALCPATVRRRRLPLTQNPKAVYPTRPAVAQCTATPASRAVVHTNGRPWAVGFPPCRQYPGPA